MSDGKENGWQPPFFFKTKGDFTLLYDLYEPRFPEKNSIYSNPTQAKCLQLCIYLVTCNRNNYKIIIEHQQLSLGTYYYIVSGFLLNLITFFKLE